MDGCDFLPLKCKKALPIFTGRNEVVAKVIFLHLSVIHSVHGGGGSASVHAGIPPPDQTPPPPPIRYHPRSDPPGPGRPPLDQTPPPRTRQTPHPTPPRQADSSIRSTSGRYASYWNAFLLHGGLLFLFTQ